MKKTSSEYESFPDSIHLSDRTSALISWAQFYNELALRAIELFRQIDEFENLHADNRFIPIIVVFVVAFEMFFKRPIKSVAMCRMCLWERDEVFIHHEKKREERY